ncbi:MAG: GNAT family N-acetyltransferase [Ignavibacteriae bacterium]|nr:GNAT family N-acetyltransferase [Ignavibacteriota bacterium]MCB9214669.1 GNAT family N-acetyltransferase [Ignavibacteria bacterium]
MNNIRYTTDLTDVSWDEMKRVLVEDSFDNLRSPKQLRESFENSFKAVIAYANSSIIGTARVLSDGVCNAYIVDVWTYTPYRRRGIAKRMVEMLTEKLDGQHVALFTEEAKMFYKRLGFSDFEGGMAKVVGAWLKLETI